MEDSAGCSCSEIERDIDRVRFPPSPVALLTSPRLAGAPHSSTESGPVRK